MNNIILITQDKEKVSTDKVRDGNYQTADTIFDDNGVVLEKK